MVGIMNVESKLPVIEKTWENEFKFKDCNILINPENWQNRGKKKGVIGLMKSEGEEEAVSLKSKGCIGASFSEGGNGHIFEWQATN